MTAFIKAQCVSKLWSLSMPIRSGRCSTFDLRLHALMPERCEFTKMRFIQAGKEQPVGFHRMGEDGK
jgi:hypothetical protein